ncbi:MAG: hypothetical protein C4527_13650 [Candidatus Omnitrophota bacterium]|nr:MAG: hypothetical protein C4527_13650 [Candidatus Omnitrophota bacterium]
MVNIRNFIIVSILFFTMASAASDLAFQSDGNGFYSFDTGVIQGALRADGESQGIPTFMDKETGIELAYGKTNPGILSFYRLFTTNHRFGDSARSWPKTAKVLPDGAVEIVWPAREEHPFTMTAVYRWKSSTILDLVTTVKAESDLPKFEVFLSSYFNSNFKSYIYIKPTLHGSEKPFFLPVEVNPFIAGTYLAFPRDRQSCQIIFDGRWEYEPHPVHFSVGKFFEYPLCVKRDIPNGITIAMMSKTEDCFAVEMPYDMTPPDGIAGHNSLYLSLFGEDIDAGQTVKAQTRLVVGRKLDEARILDCYRQFLDENQ